MAGIPDMVPRHPVSVAARAYDSLRTDEDFAREREHELLFRHREAGLAVARFLVVASGRPDPVCPLCRCLGDHTRRCAYGRRGAR